MKGKGAALSFGRRLARRGTSDSPGSDLARLPIGLELRAISIGEGIRAGLAAALPMLAAVQLHTPSLEFAAIGGLLTCIIDPGGSMRRRLAVMAGFAFAGAGLLALFSVLRGIELWLVVPFAACVVFAGTLTRIWGQHWQAAGNMVVVMMLLAVDAPLRPLQASLIGATFAVGAAWALLLALVLWRIYPYRPARRASAEVWVRLASMVDEIRRLAEAPALDLAAWDRHARATRSAIRMAIERARRITSETLRDRGPVSGTAAISLIRLEAAEQLFGLLIALTDILERTTDQAQRRAAVRLLRRVQPAFRLIASLIQRDLPSRDSRLLHYVDRLIGRDSGSPVFNQLAKAIAERLRLSLTPVQVQTPSGAAPPASLPELRERLFGPLRANLTWHSAVLRHAVRVTALVTPALIWTLARGGVYTHWLTITLLLVSQPYFSATSQRAIERIGGTVLGGLVAGGLAWVAHTPDEVVLTLVPLCTLALAVRQVSYGVFVAFYTPVVVLLVESGRPGESELLIACMRMLFTLAGGLLALAGGLLLWPSWEPDRLRSEMREALRAHAVYAGASLRLPAKLGSISDLDNARRAAGLASINLERSLSRSLHAPRRSRPPRLDAIVTVDAILRRIAGRLAALALENESEALAPADWIAWSDWVEHSLLAMTEQDLALPSRAKLRAEPALDRIARQIDLLSGLCPRLIDPAAHPAAA